MLKIEALSKRFGGVQAVNNVSLTVKKGSITGLIGPNGAGKTSVFALISGFERPDNGNISINNNDITSLPAHKMQHYGLARTFQIVQPFNGLTVLENITVGAFAKNKNRHDAHQKAIKIAKQLGLETELHKHASALTLAKRKRLEIARCLATDPQILLLDEVLAGLNPSEIRDILPVIENIRSTGVTIFMIEHVMQAVMALCEEVYVLVTGQIIAQGTPLDVTKNPQVIEAYLGASHAKH